MMAIAIGPHSSLRVSGIMASTAAAAVSMIGRKRRTADSRIAIHGWWPASMSWRIWSTRITELRMSMPNRAMMPSWATKPIGARKASSAPTTPIMPSGAVSRTIAVLEKLCSCSMSSVTTTRIITGNTAWIAPSLIRLSYQEPPASR